VASRPSPADRAVAGLATGPLGRLTAFVLDLGAALLRAARGDPHHPEERRRLP
jgi:hypothetical protein